MPARLLLDENLSERLLKSLAAHYPGSAHVRSLGAGGAGDGAVWQLARSGGYALVTRDEDFIGLSITRGVPPHVIWLNLGNVSSAVVSAVLSARREDIDRFLAQEEHTFLAIGLG